MPKSSRYRTDYSSENEDDMDKLSDMHRDAFFRYHQQGYSMIESVKLATENVGRKTGFEPNPKYLASLLEQARRMDRKNDIEARPTPSGRPRKTASSRDYDEYDDRRYAQQSSRSGQPTSGTEYDRMFQNGADKFASRTSGKFLSDEEARACANQMVDDLIAEGKNPKYAYQKAEQFIIREAGKRVAAMREQGYRFKGDSDDEEDDAAACRNARHGTSRKYREPEYDEDEAVDDYGARRNQSGYGGRQAEPKETYDTSYAYSDEDLKTIRKKIYQDWCDKGETRERAKAEAGKWYFKAKTNRRGGGKSSGSSGFDNFSNMRDALDDDDDYPREKPRTTRDSRSSKAGSDSRGYRTEERRPPGWEDPRYDRYFTEEPQEDYRSRGKTGGGSRGYRTEERRPGGSYSYGNNGAYNDELGCRKPDVDLYKLLGVSKHATMAEITKAWKKLCLKYHPDRVSGTAAKKMATEKMAQINEANDILSDAEQRAYYDRTGLIAIVGESPDA